MGTRNSCNISLLEICWRSAIVLESHMLSAQKPDSAGHIEEASICPTSMCKRSLPLPEPSAQQFPWPWLWLPGNGPVLLLAPYGQRGQVGHWERFQSSVNQKITNITPGPCAQENAYLLLLSTHKEHSRDKIQLYHKHYISAYLKV